MHPAMRLASENAHGHGSHSSNGARLRRGNGARRTSTILVVEDEVLIRMSVCEVVRDGGYRVLEASTAVEAQAIFSAREPIEVVFSDINMPGALNGVELARWVRREYSDVLGPFLRKPYTHEAVPAHFDRLLQG